MSVPAAAVAGAVFTIERSATRWAVVVAMEALLAALVSSAGMAAATVAVLLFGPDAAGLMWTTFLHDAVPLASRVTKVQVTVPAVLLPPAAETKLTWAGRTSLTVPPLE